MICFGAQLLQENNGIKMSNPNYLVSLPLTLACNLQLCKVGVIIPCYSFSFLRNDANTNTHTQLHKITMISSRGDSGMMEMQMAFAGNSDSEDEDTKVI